MELMLINKKRTLGSFCLLLSSFVCTFAQAQALSQSGTNETPAANAKLYPSGLISLSQDNPFSSYSFVVDKTKRTLSVYEWKDNDLHLISQYPADIGKATGDKTKRDDHKTPVGIYFLQSQKTQPEIPFETYGNLAFTTDYPNIFDKREAKTGSGIWLHAVPDSIPLTRGSRGCVVVRNDVIKSLKSYVKLQQTPILIFDEVKYLNAEEHDSQRQRFLKEFESWRTAWETQDVDTYIKYYAPSFKNSEMNYSQWYQHKKKLKSLYTYIKVNLTPPLILQNKDQVVIRTIQRYESNLHRDYGEKTIHARYSPEVGFQIIREDWKPLLDPVAQSKPTSKSDNSATTASEVARQPSSPN